MFTTKNRNAATICHLFSRCHYSQNRRVDASYFEPVRMMLWFLVKRWLRNTETVRSES